MLAEIAKIPPAIPPEKNDNHVKDYLHKIQNFNQQHEEDVFLDPKRYQLLKSSVERLKRLQQTVGHGNFQLLNFDDALKTARNYSQVGRFPKAELDF